MSISIGSCRKEVERLIQSHAMPAPKGSLALDDDPYLAETAVRSNVFKYEREVTFLFQFTLILVGKIFLFV